MGQFEFALGFARNHKAAELQTSKQVGFGTQLEL